MSQEIIKRIEKYRKTKRTKDSDLNFSLSIRDTLTSQPYKVIKEVCDYAYKNRMDEWFGGLFNSILFEYHRRGNKVTYMGR